MKEGTGNKFIVGLLFGIMAGALIWYWQKSTSAEDGALALLDRLAAVDARLRALTLKQEDRAVVPKGVERTTAELAPPADPTIAADNLQTIKGIGPVFEQRLRAANIRTIRQLSASNAGDLARILGISLTRAESILSEIPG